MVKQYYEAREEATQQPHIPAGITQTAATADPKKREMFGLLRGLLPGNRKDRGKDISFLAIEKSGNDPTCFLLLPKPNYYRIQKHK